MEKEKSAPSSNKLDSTRKLESSKYVFRSPQNALESSDHIAYEWLEDSIIRKMASVEIKRDGNGRDSATIKMKNPDTNKEEIVYYTADEAEIARLREISEGKTLTLEIKKKPQKP